MILSDDKYMVTQTFDNISEIQVQSLYNYYYCKTNESRSGFSGSNFNLETYICGRSLILERRRMKKDQHF